MTKNTKRILLFSAILLLGFFIGNHFARQEPERQQELQQTPPLNSQAYRDMEAECALEEFYANIELGDDKKDSVSLVKKSTSDGPCPPNFAAPKITQVKRKQTWEQTLDHINSKLVFCRNWFDTVQVLSTWLYQNSRVGDVSCHHIDRVIGKTYVAARLDIKYLYEVNNSDSVVSNCGFHCYYAIILYNFYGIKSYCFSMRSNPNRKKSSEGHMINILENPHDHKWYPVDHFLGIRYRYKGEWLDMEKYFRLSREQALGEVSIDTFGAFKFHIQDAPCVAFDAWNIDTAEIISAEPSNYRNHFRILAPFTLKHRFPEPFKALFDSIAASYNQPPHANWIDLAQRMPLYGAHIFPLSDAQEQVYADGLLKGWREP